MDSDSIPCAWAWIGGENFPKIITGYGNPAGCYEIWDQELPDFRDPATRGVLLAQVKERRNAPHGYVACGRSRCASRDYAPGVWDWCWAFWDDQETFVASGDSEVSALLAALEAAPERKP